MTIATASTVSTREQNQTDEGLPALTTINVSRKRIERSHVNIATALTVTTIEQLLPRLMCPYHDLCEFTTINLKSNSSYHDYGEHNHKTKGMSTLTTIHVIRKTH